jgi:hypothetical protein
VKRFLILLPLAACGPHFDPCLRPCNPLIEDCRCVEVDRDDRGAGHVDRPADPDNGEDNGAGSASSDAVSDDSNGDGSDE